MWVVYSFAEHAPIFDSDGNEFKFESERDACLVARVLNEFCYERCEVRKV